MADIQIPITENGAITLATEGKYCDRNVALQVEVPTYEAELEAQQVIEDGLLINTLTEFYNDRITGFIRGYIFMDATQMRIFKTPKASTDSTHLFLNCTNLEIVESDRGVGFKTFGNCTALKAVVLLGERTHLWTTNSFEGSGIEAGTGFVYVPSQLIESYKAHTNWALFASQIFPFVNTYEELSAIDGTTYPRCWVREQDKAYTYDGITWTEVAE